MAVKEMSPCPKAGCNEPRYHTEEMEELLLSPFAMKSVLTKGRETPEEPCIMRTDFQRDRDRIIHCKAFRRLKHKTQVFISPVSEHYRTRMTHTLEVTQISRTIARALRLNEDLTEAIALGHDLGHPPFGHNGEDVLNSLHSDGFRHNRQSLRVAKIIEHLNLTYETLDGIARHTGKENPETLEGQIVKTADRMAYLTHDVEDAMRAGLMSENDIPDEVSKVLGESRKERLKRMVWGMIEASMDQPVISVTPEIKDAMNALRAWMFKNIYTHPNQQSQADKVKRVIGALYEYYTEHQEGISSGIPGNSDPKQRAVDYIAGMTDRFALDLYCKLFLPIPYEMQPKRPSEKCSGRDDNEEKTLSYEEFIGK